MKAPSILVHRRSSRRLMTVMIPSLVTLVGAPGHAFADAVDERGESAQPGSAPSTTSASPVTGAPSTTSASSDAALAPPPPPPAEHQRRPWFGGLGYVSIAPFFGEISALESGLRAPD